MAEVATAYVTLLPSAKGFARGIQGQIGSDLNRAGAQGGKQFGTGMQTGVLGMASKVFKPLAVAFAGLKVGQWFGDAITAGSDFQQALGGADAVFEKNADQIKRNAENAALSLGLPKNAYLELATVLGASLKNKGVEDFAGETENLIGIGSDLAATFGGPTKDAVDALASALRGESDPIERYGISLNETAVNAKLAEMGIARTDGAYTEAQKSAARLALIQEQSADAQGQFAKEADTYAGSQERLAASWENVKTEVGTALLPALTSLSQWFLNDGLPAIKEFGGWVRDELWPALKDGWEAIQPGLSEAKEIILGAFGGESSDAVKSFAGFITDVLVPAIAVVVNEWLPMWATQIRILIEVVKGVWAVFETLRDIVLGVVRFLLEKFSELSEFWAGVLEALSRVPGFGWAKDAADKLRGAAETAQALADNIRNIPKSWSVTVGVRTVYSSTGTPGALRTSTLGGVTARASGGPVTAGQPYIVGEKRPELFVPKQDGYILPRVPSAFAGGGSATQNDNQIHIHGDIRASDPLAFEREMESRRRFAAVRGLGS